MALFRLVYTSYNHCTPADIESILISARKNNARDHITGILLHSDKRFIQYLEGEKSQLAELFSKIEADDRHTSINIRSFEAIEARIFPSWNMGYKDVSSQAMDYQTNISTEDQSTFVSLMNAELEFQNDGMRLLQLFFNY